MIAFYALGGGWGHFTRIRSFINQQGISASKKVIVSNPKAKSFFEEEELIVVPEQTEADVAHGELSGAVYTI